MKRIALWIVAGSLGLPAAPPPLQEALRRAGKAVDVFWEQFSEINCTESVSQIKLGKRGKAAYRRESAYDYVVLMHLADDDITFEESRVELRSAGNAKNMPLLVTNGFASFLFVFHRHFQGSYEYAQPEEDELDGRKALRIRFRQIRGARSPTCLRLRGRDYPIEWHGTAWIDAKDGSILKISAGLGSAMQDLGLLALNVEVQYAPVRFSGLAGEYWLPSIARIEAQTAGQHWRNIHRFTNYKHFSVNTETRTELPH